MILTIDVGNSQIYGGVFADHENGDILLRFRRTSKSGASSDEIGVFLRTVLRENGLDPRQVDKIGICTVVPEVLHSVRNACVKYFDRTPFILQAGVKTGLKVLYKNPLEVGADRISNSIAAVHEYPNQDLLIVDFGTATTFCAINRQREYMGGVITAGLRISMEALENQTSKLPSVEIIKPQSCIGRTTVESIQSGLFYGTIGQVKEIRDRISEEVFGGVRPKVIGTGGFASLLAKANVFDVENPDLVLKGIWLALGMNT